jgi:hypothetical protein
LYHTIIGSKVPVNKLQKPFWWLAPTAGFHGSPVEIMVPYLKRWPRISTWRIHRSAKKASYDAYLCSMEEGRMWLLPALVEGGKHHFP